MTIVTGTVQTFAMTGIREDLSDVITNISPMEVPFYTMCRKGKATNRNPEWLRDTLRDMNPSNAAIEGDDLTEGSTTAQPDRLKNYVQLFDDVVVVSDTAQMVNAAGRANELKYQVGKIGKAIKRDIEGRISGNFSTVIGNSSTAGKMSGAEAWITTNVSRGAAGASGGYNSGTGLAAAATDGTGRTFTETLLKTVIKSCWDAGGEPDTVMVTGSKKQTASTFGGIATQYNQINDQNKVMIYGAADVYKSDFGTHKIIPNRFMGAGTVSDGGASRSATNGLYAGSSALVLTPSTWELKFLQPFQVVNLAGTGHAEKRLLKAELTLACKEERANGVIADLS